MDKKYIYEQCVVTTVSEYIEKIKAGYVYITPNSPKHFTYLFHALEKSQNEHDNIKCFYASKLFAKDKERGLEVLTKLVEKEHISSMYLYAELLLDGNYIDKNEEKAKELFDKCVEENFALATYKKATMYFCGNGYKKDLDKSFYYASLSVRQGLDTGNFLIGRIYTNKEPNLENMQKAIEYYEKLDKDKCHNQVIKQIGFAYERLGKAYIYGKHGIQVNVSLGNEYIDKAIALYEYMKNRE